MGTVKENLIAAKALIDTPDKWIKHAFERDGCFCAVGAVRTVQKAETGRALDALYEAADELCGRGVMRFNDAENTTHADIMALFDRAIAAQDGA